MYNGLALMTSFNSFLFKPLFEEDLQNALSFLDGEFILTFRMSTSTFLLLKNHPEVKVVSAEKADLLKGITIFVDDTIPKDEVRCYPAKGPPCIIKISKEKDSE